MKTKCRYCQLEKPVDEFRLARTPAGGYSRRSRCRQCERKIGREYRAANREAYNASSSAWQRNLKTADPARYRYLKLKGHQKGRGIPFLFTLETFRAWLLKQKAVCAYCGATLDLTAFDKTVEVDRKDNNGPYVAENCCLCCWRCNRIKSCWFTFKEMKEIGDFYLRSKFGNRPAA